MKHDARKNLPRELSPTPAHEAAAAPSMAAGLRKIESLKIEPDVELHRSSSGRNIRLKHSKTAALASPHGLTPRAPDRKRPPDHAHARKRSMSAHMVATDGETEGESGAKTPTSTSTPATPIGPMPAPEEPSPGSNQVGSMPKPRRLNDKREDRRSSFMIHEPWEQLGFVRSLTTDSETETTESNQEPESALEEKAAATPLEQIVEESRPEHPLLPSTKREVYQFDLWKNASRNRRLDDAISGYDSAPSPPRPSPPRPPPNKRRSSSADQMDGEHPSPSLYDSARLLAGRQCFGRAHHSVDISRAVSDAITSSSNSSSDLSLTRSTSPIIGGSSGGRRGHHQTCLSVPLISDSDDRAIVRWRRGELLGEGTFGKVHKGLNAETGEFFALKEIEIRAAATDDQMRQLQKLSEEIEVMHSLRHDHIVRFVPFSSRMVHCPSH
jgi:hypothetical protein